MTKYKYTRKQIADRLESFYYGNRKEGDFMNDLLAKGQGECPRCHNGKLVKGICSQCGWIQGQISPIVKPKKEQGEKKDWDYRYVYCCPVHGEYYKVCQKCPTPPLREDIKEIEKITLGLEESFDPSAETRTLVLMRFGDKINELVDAINHLSSKEK